MRRACIVRLTHYPWQRNVRRNAETLVNNGYEVDVICLREKGQKKRETMNGVNLYRLPMEHHRGGIARRLFEYSTFFIMSAMKLNQLSLRKRYDVVEVHTMPDFLVFVTILPRLMGSKVILYMFENMPALFISSFHMSPGNIVVRLLRFFEKISAQYADHVITSEGIPYKQILEGRGIPEEKITVVLNVPDNAIFDLDARPVSGNGESFRLIVVSTLVKRYGVQTVIKAMPLILKEIPELKVDVVGEGEYRPELEKLAHDLGVRDYIDFAGQTRHDDVPSYIARADICLAPMIEDVGLPNKLFEYLALRKPAVASALPTLEATFDGDCLSYFQPDNEQELASRIIELYNNPEKRVSMAAKGHEFYKNCQWRTMKQVYLKTYEGILA